MRIVAGYVYICIYVFTRTIKHQLAEPNELWPALESKNWGYLNVNANSIWKPRTNSVSRQTKNLKQLLSLRRAIYKNRHMYPVSYVIIQRKLIYGSSRRKKIISFKKSSPPQPLCNHFPSIQSNAIQQSLRHKIWRKYFICMESGVRYPEYY